MTRLGIVRSNRLAGDPRGIRFAYGHGFGWFKWLPYQAQRLFVEPWNAIVCRLYGHSWVPIAENGLTTCCDCSAKRPATPEEIDTGHRLDAKVREIRERHA